MASYEEAVNSSKKINMSVFPKVNGSYNLYDNDGIVLENKTLEEITEYVRQANCNKPRTVQSGQQQLIEGFDQY